MAYVQNTQLDTSRDGINAAAANVPKPQAAIERARAVIAWIGQQGVDVGDLRKGWGDVVDRPRDPGEAGFAQQASALLAFATSKKGEAEQQMAAAHQAWADRQGQIMMARNAVIMKAQWAETHCKAYWQLGDAIDALGDRVRATKRPIASGTTTSPMSDMPWEAPIATKEELMGALTVLEADLAALTASAAAARKALKA